MLSSSSSSITPSPRWAMRAMANRRRCPHRRACVTSAAVILLIRTSFSSSSSLWPPPPPPPPGPPQPLGAGFPSPRPRSPQAVASSASSARLRFSRANGRRRFGSALSIAASGCLLCGAAAAGATAAGADEAAGNANGIGETARGEHRRLVPQGGRVAVIGAGAAGISAARSLKDFADGTLQVDVFEQGPGIGGTWIYDEHGQFAHSSMYKNLKTNIPKEVMPFIGEAFEARLPSYISHQDVLSYLEDVADKHDLRRLIRLNSTVTLVSPEEDAGGGRKWAVEWEGGGRKERGLYDAVFVCNGHYTSPIIPPIPGLEGFKGNGARVIHAHNYRVPEDFKDANVVVVGAGPSGVDISLEISKRAKKVYIAQKGLKEQTETKAGILAVPPISNLREDRRAEFGSPSDVIVSEPLDAVVFCTGYDDTFPFLDPSIGVSVRDRGVRPLYKHMYLTSDPSLVFIGLPWKVAPFPLFDCQTRHAARAMCGLMELPAREQMEEARRQDERMRFEEMGLPKRYYHQFGNLQWDYCRTLACEANDGRLYSGFDIDTAHEIYQDAGRARREDVRTYRERNYVVEAPGEWTVSNPNTPTEEESSIGSPISIPSSAESSAQKQ